LRLRATGGSCESDSHGENQFQGFHPYLNDPASEVKRKYYLPAVLTLLFPISQGVVAMLHIATVTSIYDARRFRLDLIKELRRRNSPRYPQRDFWRALERADSADVVRAVTAVNAAEDFYYFDRQQSRRFNDLDDVDSKYLIAGYSPEKAAARGAHAYSVKVALAIPQPEAVCS
jgi:hypothetical protein